MLSNPCQWGCRMPRRGVEDTLTLSPDCRGEPCVSFHQVSPGGCERCPYLPPTGMLPLGTQGCHSCHFPPVCVTLMPFTAVFDLWRGQKTRDGKTVCKHKGMNICWSC